MKLLSICIPTYNRVKQLEELITSLLEVKSDDFEVVITNNCSTDNTLKMLDGIKDDRLVVYTNQSPEPAFYNMILSIYNANGKYALYCNDRDVIFAERLLSFIEFLRNHEYSFLRIEKCYGSPTFNLKEFKKGFESLINHPYCNHPTGLVYNVDFLKKYLRKEDYLKHVEDIYTWCFLSRDLVIYENTAKYDNYLWDERPSVFKVQSASGSVHKGKLFFETETAISLMQGVVIHLIGNPHFSLSPSEQKTLLLDIFDSFCERLMCIKPRFISYSDMKKAYDLYFKECDNVLKQTQYLDELSDVWNMQKESKYKCLLKDCLLCDYSIIIKKIRRLFSPSYRY